MLFPMRVLQLLKVPRALLDGLRKRGFRLNYGIDNAGFVSLAYTRGGGYYIGELSIISCSLRRSLMQFADVGASQLIIDGKIKLKNDSQISHLSEKQISFENGSTLDTDVILLATG